MLKNKNRIMSRVKSCNWRTSQKFGIALTHCFEETDAMDEDNGKSFLVRFY